MLEMDDCEIFNLLEISICVRPESLKTNLILSFNVSMFLPPAFSKFIKAQTQQEVKKKISLSYKKALTQSLIYAIIYPRDKKW